MTADPTTRRLAAIVAADVAGFARLMGADEAGTLAALRAIRRDLIDPAIASHRGRVVKTMGDGLLLEFASATEAVACCLEVQRAMAGRNAKLPAGRRIAFRIGINLGDVIPEGEDIFGDGVNIAARLEALADPGGICVSRAVMREAGPRLRLRAEDMGQRALKNIEAPVHAFRLRAGGASAPAPATGPRDLAEAMPLPPARPSLAILPFRNLNADPETGFVTDGIALGLQTLLVQLSGIFFVNACRHQGYRSGEATAAEALAGMPVEYAIEGAVQKAGQRVRVNVQVSQIETGALILAESYDRPVTDVFALQDEIAARIAGALSIELIGGHIARDFTVGLDSPDAWQHFLRGIDHLYRWTQHDCLAAIPHFEALAASHPETAIGPCYLAVLHYMAALQNWVPSPAEAFAEAERWARLGVEEEAGNNGLAHAVLGAFRLDARDHDESLALCRTAVGYRSNCPFALGQLGRVETYCGDPVSGIKHTREAMAVRIAHPPSLVDGLAIAYRDRGSVDLSIPAAREAIRIDPGFLDAQVTLCSDLALEGDSDGARTAAAEILAAAPAFTIAGFMSRQPYRAPEIPDRLRGALAAAGLPN